MVSGEDDFEDLLIEKTFVCNLCKIIFERKVYDKKAFIRAKCITKENATKGGYEVAQAIYPIRYDLPIEFEEEI